LSFRQANIKEGTHSERKYRERLARNPAPGGWRKLHIALDSPLNYTMVCKSRKMRCSCGMYGA